MRTLIADDHGIVRCGLRLLLERQPDIEVVAEAGDGVEAFELALATRPDLCVLDVGMPRMTGLQATREIRAHLPDTHVLIVSMHDDERYLFEALKAGAAGYVLKREADQALVGALHAIARGEPFLTNAAERTLIRRWMEEGALGPDEPLTAREQQVVKLIAEAHTNAQSPRRCTSRRRRSSRTARTCCASSACATASSSCATRSGAGSSRRSRCRPR